MPWAPDEQTHGREEAGLHAQQLQGPRRLGPGLPSAASADHLCPDQLLQPQAASEPPLARPLWCSVLGQEDTGTFTLSSLQAHGVTLIPRSNGATAAKGHLTLGLGSCCSAPTQNNLGY